MIYLKQTLFTDDLEICKIIIDLLGNQKCETVRNQSSEILEDFLLSNNPISQEPKIKQKMAVAFGELGNQTAISCLKKTIS
ncbi:PBS lyase HEAT-like repeat [Crocosphaera watsonii WH 0402]|uniref:PBS lyase HEAT-like repeat n=1 Tax=Crocosphaera watsonii WH 0402 TaxID=1284629 RepID=T2JVY6_CROWT|nr:hypothetical protein [Crocosphaera watsonii]CCQ69196.1 PBS lyase HEAT-like repeat [Crocosphaera watsonii WH 0402]